MKKALSLILAVLMVLPLLAAAEQQHVLVPVRCETQGFTTLCLDNQAWEPFASGGLVFWTDPARRDSYVLVSWSKEADHDDPEGYFTRFYTPLMQNYYGDRLEGYSDYRVYEVEGIPMPGVQYAWHGEDGRVYITFHLLDLRWEGIVTYSAEYYYEEQQEPMNVLCRCLVGFKPDAASAAKGMGAYRVRSAESIVPKTAVYSCAEFTATLPVGWKVVTGGLMETFAVLCYDPENPERCIFLMNMVGPFLKSQEAKNWWVGYPNAFNLRKPLIDNAPVLSVPSVGETLRNLPAFREYIQVVYPMHLAAECIPPEVVPDFRGVQILETSAAPALSSYRDLFSRYNLVNRFPDASVNRFTCVSSRGKACEGIAGGITIDIRDPYSLNPSLDVYFYYCNCLVGVTAPEGELQELAPVLLSCLCSFRFNDAYIRQAQQKGQEIGAILELSGGCASSWESRNRSYDVMSQKYSDATLGYDRLYDSETGEVYRAELGFYDSYDLHRGEYANPNLYLIDDRTKSYYLEGVDYYITR